MRLFQFIGIYQQYLETVFPQRYPTAHEVSYRHRLDCLLDDHFGGPHILQPVYDRDSNVGFTVADDLVLQRQWAREHGMATDNLEDILLAQIEERRAEIVYSMHPVKFNNSFLKRLPGSVKKTLCWHAAPDAGADLSGYDLRVCNFPGIIKSWEAQGLRGGWFSPSYDPVMADYVRAQERPIDVAFVGGYTRSHTRRNGILKAVARLADRFNIVFCLSPGRLIPLSSLPVLKNILVPSYLPRVLKRVDRGPVYGRQLYDIFGSSKIVLNCAIDMAGQYRGNIRCFESMGCGSLMVSDEGIYPSELRPGEHFLTYTDANDAAEKICDALKNVSMQRSVANAGKKSIEQNFSKEGQWLIFQKLVEAL
ncbi:MAG: glycosyltransferase [Pseudomonadota bacterium]